MVRKKLMTDKVRLYINDKRCQLCFKEITDLSQANIDHILPKSRGGTDAIENLQLTHHSCNQQKGNWILPKILDKKDMLNEMEGDGWVKGV